MISSGNVGNLFGFCVDPYIYGAGATGNVNSIIGFELTGGAYGGGATSSVTTWKQIDIGNPSTNCPTTNKYGIYIASISGASSSNYNIFSASPGYNYFGGYVGINYGMNTTAQLTIVPLATTVVAKIDKSGTLTATGGIFNGQYYAAKKTATTAIDFSTGNVQYLQLVNNGQTLTFANPADGARYVLILKQPASGAAGTITWPTVKWASGFTPTLTATNGKVDIVTLIYDGTNTCYYGGASLNY
jgi:hypothetical protein